jgi:hypothetical protein
MDYLQLVELVERQSLCSEEESQLAVYPYLRHQHPILRDAQMRQQAWLWGYSPTSIWR